jgi:cell division protein FtsB
MAAVSQPSSRAGLITSLVVFVALFFVAAVLAIVSFSDKRELEKKLGDAQKKYDLTIKTTEMTDAQYSELTDLIREKERGRSVFDILVQQREDLARTITGQSNVKAGQATAAAAGAIDAANKSLQPTGASVPGGGMVQAVSALTRIIMDRQGQIGDLQAQLAAANAEMKRQIDAYKKELDQHRAGVETAKGEATKAVADTTQYRASKDEQIGQLEKSLQEAIERGRKTAEDLTTQLAGRQQDLDKLQKERTQLILLVTRYRPRDVGEVMIRRAAGHIRQVERNNVCYIDLGLGKQLSPGMTFEVYDKTDGMPRVSTTQDDQLPVGKASIEVVHVSTDSSECHVIRVQPGQQLQEGDLIANLIYDPNVRRGFMVYGNFDIDQNGVATPQEADIVKRLIVQWGGGVVEKIGVDTDFLVMGKEPVLPSITKEQLASDPIAKFDYEKAELASKAYDEVRNKAVELHIPVMNQTRFLYLIGYFDQARK